MKANLDIIKCITIGLALRNPMYGVQVYSADNISTSNKNQDVSIKLGIKYNRFMILSKNKKVINELTLQEIDSVKGSAGALII